MERAAAAAGAAAEKTTGGSERGTGRKNCRRKKEKKGKARGKGRVDLLVRGRGPRRSGDGSGRRDLGAPATLGAMQGSGGMVNGQERRGRGG